MFNPSSDSVSGSSVIGGGQRERGDRAEIYVQTVRWRIKCKCKLQDKIRNIVFRDVHSHPALKVKVSANTLHKNFLCDRELEPNRSGQTEISV